MINLSVTAVSGKSAQEVADAIKIALKSLPPPNNNGIKLSLQARQELGGKKSANIFLTEVKRYLQ